MCGGVRPRHDQKPLIALSVDPAGAVVVSGNASGTIGTQGPGSLSLTWKWTGTELRVSSEPFGFFPAFYVADRSRFALALSVADLIPHMSQPRLDRQALSVFLYTGLYLEDATYLEDVTAIPEGGQVTWAPGEGAKVSSRPMSPGASTAEEVELAREYGRLWSHAVKTLPSAPVSIPLSGGRDSRWLLLEWLSLGRPVAQAVTAEYFPARFSNDVELATRLAQTVDIDHVVLPQNRRLVDAELVKNSLSSFAFLESSWQIVLAEQIDSAATPVLDGLVNDVLARGTFWGLEAHQSAAIDPEATAAHLFTGRASRQVDLFVGEDFRIEPWPEVVRIVQRSLGSYADCHNPLTEFQLWNRTRRQNAALSLASYGPAQVFCPALDDSLFTFLRSLPLEVASGKPFQTSALAMAHPDFADFPYEAKPGGRVPLGFRRQVVTDLARLAVSGPDVMNERVYAVRAAKALVSSRPPRFFLLEADRVVYMHQLIEQLQSAGVA